MIEHGIPDGLAPLGRSGGVRLQAVQEGDPALRRRHLVRYRMTLCERDAPAASRFSVAE